MNLQDLRNKFRLPQKPYTTKFWVILIIFIIVILLFYYILLDRFTPYTSDAYIQAYVTQIAPQVEGPVTKIYVTNDSYVEKGQPLFEIDYRPYDYKVKQLEANLVKTRQDIMQLESSIEAANAVVTQSKADVDFAKKRVRDLQNLVEQNYIARLQFDQARDDMNAKVASLNKAKADLRRAEQSLALKIEGDYAIIKEVESNLELAKYYLTHTTVYAPSDGLVSNLQLSIGTYVNAGEPVMSFVDAKNWWILANFKENSMGRIRPGQSAEVSIALYPGKIFKAKVESLDWGVSAGQGTPSGELPVVKNPQNWVKLAQRFPVRLKLTDLDSDHALRIGGSTSVTIDTGGGFILNGLARLWLRIGSYVNYIY
jgi:multidrug resistance efflux pump